MCMRPGPRSNSRRQPDSRPAALPDRGRTDYALPVLSDPTPRAFDPADHRHRPGVVFAVPKIWSSRIVVVVVVVVVAPPAELASRSDWYQARPKLPWKLLSKRLCCTVNTSKSSPGLIARAVVRWAAVACRGSKYTLDVTRCGSPGEVLSRSASVAAFGGGRHAWRRAG